MSKGKILSLDYGDRRVGVAISDEDKAMAFPRGFLEYDNLDALISQIHAIVEEEEVVKVILGLPISMDGSSNEQVIKTQAFGDQLQTVIHNVRVEYFDERLTSKEAEKLLKEKSISTKGEKGEIDAISAQLILEAYLNSLKG